MTDFFWWARRGWDWDVAGAVVFGVLAYQSWRSTGTAYDVQACACLIVSVSFASWVLRWVMTPPPPLVLPSLPTGAAPIKGDR